MADLFQTLQLLTQFKQFASQFQNGKQDPTQLLDQLVKSGQVSQQQLQQAKQMAEMFQSLLGGRK